MELTKLAVARKIRSLGVRGAHFQVGQLREQLVIDGADKNKRARMHNHLKSLERDGIVEVVPGDRKRNRYYRIKDDVALRSLLATRPASGNGEPRPAGPAADRLARIEASIHTVEERLDHMDGKLDELLELWS